MHQNRPTSRICAYSTQHPVTLLFIMIFIDFQQVNTLELAPSRSMLASGGYQNIILYDMNSVSPVVSFESVSKNVTRLGFQEVRDSLYLSI